jgi:site-specific DNA-methyltransferase (adenine-specific)
MPVSEVFNEDCMVGMARYPDKFFDLAIVDPPYGLSIHKMNFTQSRVGGVAKRKDYSSIGKWDDSIPDIEYIDELQRVSKNQIIWGANYFMEYLKSCKGFIIWDKRVEDKYGQA